MIIHDPARSVQAPLVPYSLPQQHLVNQGFIDWNPVHEDQGHGSVSALDTSTLQTTELPDLTTEPEPMMDWMPEPTLFRPTDVDHINARPLVFNDTPHQPATAYTQTPTYNNHRYSTVNPTASAFEGVNPQLAGNHPTASNPPLAPHILNQYTATNPLQAPFTPATSSYHPAGNPLPYPCQNHPTNTVAQLARQRVAQSVHQTMAVPARPRKLRTCRKCGIQNCSGRQSVRHCRNPCQDCGVVQCSGRNPKRPNKKCWEAWLDFDARQT